MKEMKRREFVGALICTVALAAPTSLRGSDTVAPIAPLPPNYCGPNALLVALTLLGFDTSMDRILEKVEITERGSSLSSLQTCAVAHGAKATGYRLDWGSLKREVRKASTIAILDVDGHFVVLTAAGDSLYVIDPPKSLERVLIEREDLSDRVGLIIPVMGESGRRRTLRWTGVALMVSRDRSIADILGL